MDFIITLMGGVNIVKKKKFEVGDKVIRRGRAWGIGIFRGYAGELMCFVDWPTDNYNLLYEDDILFAYVDDRIFNETKKIHERAKKKKSMLTWCASCCQWVSTIHTCFDYIECLVEDWCSGTINNKNLYNKVKNIAARTKIYHDFAEDKNE